MLCGVGLVPRRGHFGKVVSADYTCFGNMSFQHVIEIVSPCREEMAVNVHLALRSIHVNHSKFNVVKLSKFVTRRFITLGQAVGLGRVVCGVFFKFLKDRAAAQRQLMIGFWWDSRTLTRTLDEVKLLS